MFLAFPYNPYHPLPYPRFTELGMMDHPNDFVIGEEYWNLIGGENTFQSLLYTFDEVGKEFKDQLKANFKRLRSKR